MNVRSYSLALTSSEPKKPNPNLAVTLLHLLFSLSEMGHEKKINQILSAQQFDPSTFLRAVFLSNALQQKYRSIKYTPFLLLEL